MSWSEFLRALNPDGDSSLPATWRLSDGKSLRLQIPAAEAIGDEDLIGKAAALLPYKLYEIVELEIEPDPAQDNVPARLEAIEQAARVSNLIYRRKPERIIIRSPYTC